MSRVFLFVRAKLLNVRYWHLADIATPTNQCPLSGVKRTSCGIVAMSANDPKPTSMFCGQCTRIVQGSASGLKYSDRCCMNWTVTAAKPQSCGCLFWRDRREAVFCLLHRISPLLAQSGHPSLHCTCPRLGVKRTSYAHAATAACLDRI